MCFVHSVMAIALLVCCWLPVYGQQCECRNCACGMTTISTKAGAVAYKDAHAEAVATGRYVAIAVGNAAIPAPGSWISAQADTSEMDKWDGKIVVGYPSGGSLYLVEALPASASAGDIDRAIARHRQLMAAPVYYTVQGGSCANGSCVPAGGSFAGTFRPVGGVRFVGSCAGGICK